MKSFREAAIREGLSRIPPVPDSPISARKLAQRVGLNPPVTFTDLIAMIEFEEQTFHGNLVTPTGTALGGSVDLTLRSNGKFDIQFHIHDSGIPDYDFQVRAIFTTSGGLVFVSQYNGHVEGTESTSLTHAPNRDSNHQESGINPLIRANWLEIKKGQLWITKEYSATGLSGFVQDVAKAVLDVAAISVGGALGVVIGLGTEASQLLRGLGLDGPFGVIAGVVVFVAGGSIVMAIVAGAAVGSVTNAMIRQRELSPQESAFAARIFGGSLPPANQIVLTNLSGLGGRAFTIPGADEKIYVNLGNAFYEPLQYHSDSYPTHGQVLIHELVHVWQIKHNTFLPGTVCASIVNQANNIVGQSVYVYGPPGPAWGNFNLEAQAAIVDQWFAGTKTVVVPNRTPMDGNDPYFGYIRDNIRNGQT
ncbi:hypothetical protein QEG73_01035 [Chitinophagaceae bacterium 26-R-25]|nr:hypothetical protein [Chitinophagaceae bacterium 26-R-25]